VVQITSRIGGQVPQIPIPGVGALPAGLGGILPDGSTGGALPGGSIAEVPSDGAMGNDPGVETTPQYDPRSQEGLWDRELREGGYDEDKGRSQMVKALTELMRHAGPEAVKAKLVNWLRAPTKVKRQRMRDFTAHAKAQKTGGGAAGGSKYQDPEPTDWDNFRGNLRPPRGSGPGSDCGSRHSFS